MSREETVNHYLKHRFRNPPEMFEDNQVRSALSRRDDGAMQHFAKGDTVQVIEGAFEGCTGVVAGPVEGSARLVLVDVFGRGAPALLRDDQLCPYDGDGRGGVREPATPKPPSDRHAT